MIKWFRQLAVVANTLICLIHQTNYLLDQQFSALERSFVHDGGYSEQLATARMAERQQKHPSDQTEPTDKIPKCPLCGKFLALRTAKRAPVQVRSSGDVPATRNAKARGRWTVEELKNIGRISPIGPMIGRMI